MKTFQFYPKLLIRTPLFSIEEINKDLRQVLLLDDFRLAILLSSPIVYRQLEKVGFNWEECNDKLRFTLSKYYRRMCSRATPFANLAAIAQSEWADGSGEIYIDTGRCELRMLKAYTLPAKSYQLNPALFEAGNFYRFLSGKSRSGIYTLTEIAKESLPPKLLKQRNNLSEKDLLEIFSAYGLDLEAGKNYIKNLLEQEILQSKPKRPAFAVADVIDNGPDDPNMIYTAAFRPVTGNLPVTLQTNLLNALALLNGLSEKSKPTPMQEFCSRFRTLYDRKAVPLLEALDPEIGINYSTFKAPKIAEGWSKAKSLLLKKWTLAAASAGELVFDEEDIEFLSDPQKRLSPSLMVMFERLGTRVLLKEAGGVCASALAARFSVFDNDIWEMCKRLCQVEQQQNPEVLFADLCFEGVTEPLKINRRQALREYEIALFGTAMVPDKKQIHLHDLYLVLHDDELILWSKRLQKRIIPRINSAYNYDHSKQDLICFLGDLQFEGLNTSFANRLEDSFPGQDYYPAMRYKNILLSPEVWILPEQFIKSITAMSTAEGVLTFTFYCNENKLAKKLWYGEHDQCMLVSTDDLESVMVLLRYLDGKRGRLRLTACHSIYPPAMQVKDEQGKAYVAEYIAFLHNPKTVYHQAPIAVNLETHNRKRNFLPLQEWYYLKIYLAPETTDDFLRQQVFPFIANCQSKAYLFLWHFLRFKDHGDHIRLRLKAYRESDSQLLQALKSWIASLQDVDGIYNVVMETYERELERYACVGPEDTELLFRDSSEWVKVQINSETTENARMLHAITLLWGLLEGFLNEEQIIAFCSRNAEAFLSLVAQKDIRITFDCAFRELKAEGLGDEFPSLSGDTKMEIGAIRSLAQTINSLDYLNFICDFFHLHVNRLFARNQKEKEALCYHCLQKWMKAKIALAKQGIT